MPFVLRSRLALFILLAIMCIPFYFIFLRLPNDVSEKLLNLEDMFKKIDAEHTRRKKHISQACKFLNISGTISDISASYLDHFIIDDVNKLVYCFVPKVACTNWKRVLMTLQNSETKDPLSLSGNEMHQPNVFKTLTQYSAEDINTKLNTYTKFMFARHPYERILSAYRNKFEESYVDYFRLHFGIDIIKNFRENASKASLEKGHDVTFEEYIQYILSLSPKSWKKSFNEHWRPISNLCFPCHIEYDFIGKYETLEQDAAYILQKTALSKFVKFPERQQSYKKQKTGEVMQAYYKNISTDLQKKLYKTYEEDFTLFEYEVFFYT